MTRRPRRWPWTVCPCWRNWRCTAPRWPRRRWLSVSANPSTFWKRRSATTPSGTFSAPTFCIPVTARTSPATASAERETQHFVICLYHVLQYTRPSRVCCYCIPIPNAVCCKRKRGKRRKKKSQKNNNNDMSIVIFFFSLSLSRVTFPIIWGERVHPPIRAEHHRTIQLLLLYNIIVCFCIVKRIVLRECI